MHRRTFLAGLLASTAIRPGAEQRAIVQWDAIPPVRWEFQGTYVTASLANTIENMSPITLEALDDLAKAVRWSFERDRYRAFLQSRLDA